MTKLLILLTVICFSSCASPELDTIGYGYAEYVEFVNTFQKQKAAWESLNMDHYRFTAVRHTSSRPWTPMIITVYPDKEPDWTYYDHRDAHLPLPEKDPLGMPGSTITELLSYIEWLITATQSSSVWEKGVDYYRTRAVYDDLYHFPREIGYVILPVVPDNPPKPNGGNGWGFEIMEFLDLSKQ